MSKKATVGFELVIGIVILAALAIVAMPEDVKDTLFCINCEGFTTLSLNQVDFISNDNVIGGRTWLLTIAQNGMGQYAVGTFNKDSIKDAQSGEQAQNDLKISMNMDSQSCNYPLSYQGTSLHRYNVEKRTSYIGEPAGFKTECQAKPNYKWVKKSWTYDFYCLYTTEEAKYGSIGTPTLEFDSTLSAEVAGKGTVTGQISNIGQRSVWLGDKVYASWAGNLVTGEQCPIASDQKLSSAYYKGAWRTIDDTDYQSYKTSFQVGLDTCISRYLDGYSETPYSCTSTHNSYLDDALQQKNLVSNGGATATSSGTLSSGQASIQLQKSIQYPVMSLRIDADWVGIFIPVGKPDIQSITSTEFQTGYTGYIVTTVKNIGFADGSFAVNVNCPLPFKQQGADQTLSVKKGMTSIVNTPITSSVSDTTSKTCTVKVYDYNNPSNYDVGQVTVKSTGLLVCQANQQRCNGKVIEQCNSGTAWVAKESCSYQCKETGATAECVEAPPEKCADVAWYDIPTKIECGMNDIYGALGKIFFAIIILLIAFAYVQYKG